MIITPKTEEKNLSIREWVAEQSPDSILLTGYDNCVVGISPSGSVIYSTDDILKTLVGMEHDWGWEDAIEWFDYNIFGSVNPDNELHPTFITTIKQSDIRWDPEV
jgi:hypothetical protein